ncbi:hypothetical protein [Sphingopyxis sp. KK2]|uniref:hypothetical protein n=1 Tax=Sphingopyxis sp. KK2 TaxID=1855727 RepID=UPI00097E5BBE|nr:hypothetical protein [Sphingopyxis sp. KK2]
MPGNKLRKTTRTKINGHDIVVAPPAEFDDDERALFRCLVIEAGEVGGNALDTNIENAKALAFLYSQERVEGIAALKRPQMSYRNRISKNTGVLLSTEPLPYEFGYMFVRPVLQGKRLSFPLACATLDAAEGADIFATVRADNIPSYRTLVKAGFEAAGSFPGREDREIALFIRRSAIP